MIKICKMGHALRAVQPYISQVKQPDLRLINIVRFSTLFFCSFLIWLQISWGFFPALALYVMSFGI